MRLRPRAALLAVGGLGALAVTAGAMGGVPWLLGAGAVGLAGAAVAWRLEGADKGAPATMLDDAGAPGGGGGHEGDGGEGGGGSE
jgi:hypothetical protein